MKKRLSSIRKQHQFQNHLTVIAIHRMMYLLCCAKENNGPCVISCKKPLFLLKSLEEEKEHLEENFE